MLDKLRTRDSLDDSFDGVWMHVAEPVEWVLVHVDALVVLKVVDGDGVAGLCLAGDAHGGGDELCVQTGELHLLAPRPELGNVVGREGCDGDGGAIAVVVGEGVDHDHLRLVLSGCRGYLVEVHCLYHKVN